MTEPHIADAESEFFILNVTPDFCDVDDTTVPFDISQTLKPEKSDFAKSVFARGEPVIMVRSIIDGVKGNAGSGVTSGVSLDAGHSEVSPNDATVYVEDRQVARHLDRVGMNGVLIPGVPMAPKTAARQAKSAKDKDLERILKERKIPYSVDEEGRVHYANLDNRGKYVLLPGDEVRTKYSYLDPDGKAVYVDSKDDIPAGASHVEYQELSHEGKELGKDFGPPQEWTDKINEERTKGYVGGDAAESLRRQVAVDANKHPELADYIDPGTGQVNPLEWDKFKSEAKSEGLPMGVTSNGLDNLYQTGRDNARILADGKDAVFVNVYNPTTGSPYLGDGAGEAVPAAIWGQKQTVQVSITSEMRQGLKYNAELDKDLYQEQRNGTTKTVFVGHSQGTINGSLALSPLKTEEQKNVDAYYMGTAMNRFPMTGNISNITDNKDPVTQMAGGREVEKDWRFKEGVEKGQHHAVHTNMTADATDPSANINHHSFYLYAQQPEVQARLGFTKTPPVLTRPFPKLRYEPQS